MNQNARINKAPQNENEIEARQDRLVIDPLVLPQRLPPRVKCLVYFGMLYLAFLVFDKTDGIEQPEDQRNQQDK